MIEQERELAVTQTPDEPALTEGRVRLTKDDSGVPRESVRRGETDIDDLDQDDIDMESLIDQSMSEIENGQIITGKVLKVTTDDVVVDIGSKSEGVINLHEFLDDGKDPNVFVGMDVEVMVVSREGRDGLPILSRKRAKERMAKRMLRRAFKNGEPVRCVIKDILRGGFQVDVDGVRGFIPFSQMGPGARSPEEQKALIGQVIEAKILEMRNRRDLILSQRQWLEERREKLRTETLANLKAGYWVKGIVKNLTDFGAFVDLGGIDGLLHVKDMSWGHVAHPREMVHVGMELDVMVLAVEGERISLGLKQKSPDPWMNIQEKFPPGMMVTGKVTSLTKYGAFVCLEDGVEGLIHISEMSWTKRIHHPSELLKEGDEIQVKVLSIDEERQRISLSLRQTSVDPWTLAKANYPPGTIIEGEVTGMTDFGAFVQLPEGVDGMIHVSDLSWGEKINHPKQVLKKGDKIRCKVLEIDPRHQRISLGLKHMEPDPWAAAREKYPVGSAVEVKVTRITEFGAFVELEQGIEGLAHVSTLVKQKGQRAEDVVKVGDIVTMKILKFDLENRKISLSLKDYIKEQEDKEVKKYISTSAGGNATLGELLGEQMQALMLQRAASEQEAEKVREETVSVKSAPEPVAESVMAAVAEPVTEAPPEAAIVEPVMESTAESVSGPVVDVVETVIETAVEAPAETPAPVEPADAAPQEEAMMESPVVTEPVGEPSAPAETAVEEPSAPAAESVEPETKPVEGSSEAEKTE
ncbi:MAG: 30S ribosomal protein S1 [bacterium]